jgi:DNA-binding MarR family transcriptional regulator
MVAHSHEKKMSLRDRARRESFASETLCSIIVSLKRGGILEHFGHKFKMIDQLFKMRMNKNLEDLDITTSQMHVLIYLENHENEKVTQKILSQVFNVKHSTMAGILQRMQEKGLINITVDEENKKFKNITRTEKADKIKSEMDKHRNHTEAVLSDGFSQEELEILSKMLDRIYDNLTKDSFISEKDKSRLERRKKLK